MNDKKLLLDEHWDDDPSASDNESYEIEMETEVNNKQKKSNK